MLYLGIFLSALIGSAVAALADLLQKGAAGAVVTLQTTMATLLGLNLATIWAILLLMILGTALCFVFQPTTRQAGFALGLSVISVIMTATPTKPPSSPAGLPVPGTTSLGTAGTLLALESDKNVRSDWPVFRVQVQPSLLRLNFEVGVRAAQPGPLGSITIRVRELPGGQIWQWKTEQFERQTNFPAKFYYEIPVKTGTTAVEARIEPENYGAATVQGAVTPGASQVQLTYSLEKSAPGIIKQLFQQRSF